MGKKKTEGNGVATEAPEEKQKPVQSWKYALPGGTGFMESAVFARPMKGEHGDWTAYSISLHRSYFSEKDNAWKGTQYMRPEHIIWALHCLKQAWTWIVETKACEPQ